MSKIKTIRRVATLGVSLVVLAGCGGNDPDADQITTTTPTTVEAPMTTTAPTPPPTDELPAALAERLDWLLAVLNDTPFTEAVYRDTFAEPFLMQVGYDEMVAVVDEVAGLGTGWTMVGVDHRVDLDAVLRIEPQTGDALVVNISLEPEPPHRIQGLLLSPTEVPELEDQPSSIEEAALRLGELGSLELLVAEVDGDQCRPVHRSGTGEAVSVASAIKLYVLAAVVDAVEDGRLAWDDPVVIEDHLKSIPTGELQNEPAGTEFTVEEMASAMIAISDNTATDHLITLVGREAVEAALGRWGMSAPSANTPFLTTRELTALKLGPPDDELDVRWLAADLSGRRAMLDELDAIAADTLPLQIWRAPRRVEELAWFASTDDLCRVLAELMARPAPVPTILSLNPGVPDPDAAFTTIGFKGGSEPGVLSLNWWVERPDGRRFVVAGTVVNPEEAINEFNAGLLLAAIRGLVVDLD